MNKGKVERIGGEFYLPLEEASEPTSEVDRIRRDLALQFEGEEVPSPVQAKRERFLLAVERLEPLAKENFSVGVLESLSRDVLPLYIEVFDIGGGTYKAYRAALTRWCERWHLDTIWIRNAAETTLGSWSTGWIPEYRGHAYEWQMLLECDSSHYHSAEEIALNELFRGTPTTLGYDPFSHDRKAVKAAFKKRLELAQRRFEAFLDEQDEKARGGGAQRTKETRNALHFDWLAQYQVLGWSDSTILEHAEQIDLSLDAARMARERLAEEIRLALR